MKNLFVLVALFLPFTAQGAEALSSEVVISVGCGNGLVGKPGDLVVMQEAPFGGRLLGVFPKKDADNPQGNILNINIGSSNGLIGKPGDVMVVQAAPMGGIPLGLIATSEGKFDPEKQIQLSFHRSNGLSGAVGDLAIHQPGPFGGSPLASYPRDGGKDCKPMRLKIGLGNGIRGKKTEVAVTEILEGGGSKLLTILKKPTKSIGAPEKNAEEHKTIPAH